MMSAEGHPPGNVTDITVNIAGISVWVATCLASLASSAYMLYSVNRLPPTIASKLMARQIWHLGLADACASSLRLLNPTLMTVDLVLHGQSGDPHPSKAWTTGSYIVCNLAIASSLFKIVCSMLDMHIAFASAMKIVGWSAWLHRLNVRLWLAWPLGAAIGGVFMLLTIFFNTERYDESTHICRFKVWTSSLDDVNEEFLNAWLILSVLVSVVVYIVTSTVNQSYATRERICSRGTFFLFANLLSQGPACFWMFVHSNWISNSSNNRLFRDTLWYFFVNPLYNLAGVINLWMYLLLCQKAQTMLRQAKELRLEGGESSPRPVSRTSQGDSPLSSDEPRPISFDVCFADGGPEVINVARVGREAMRRAELETCDIESRNVFSCLEWDYDENDDGLFRVVSLQSADCQVIDAALLSSASGLDSVGAGAPLGTRTAPLRDFEC